METYVGDLFPATVSRHWASDQRRRSRPARPRPDGRGRHVNSLAAHEAGEAATTKRRREVIAYVAAHNPLTVREILHGMFPGSDNLNLVAPRVSEALERGELIEFDTVTCPVSKRPVMRVVVPGGAA